MNETTFFLNSGAYRVFYRDTCLRPVLEIPTDETNYYRLNEICAHKKQQSKTPIGKVSATAAMLLESS